MLNIHDSAPLGNDGLGMKATELSFIITQISSRNPTSIGSSFEHAAEL